jgi:hypothetical protein
MFSRLTHLFPAIMVLALCACNVAAPEAEDAGATAALAASCEDEARSEKDNYPVAIEINASGAPEFVPINAERGYDRRCAVLVSALDRDLRVLVQRYLDVYHMLSEDGRRMVRAQQFDDGVVALREDDTHAFVRALVGGTRYMIIGACDNECQDIDIALVASTGEVVDADFDRDPYPMVNITPPEDGEYRIVVSMFSCSIEPCYAGVRVLELSEIYNRPATFGDYALTSPLRPDPLELEVAAGGNVDMNTLQSSCVGFIAESPDMRIFYTPGEKGAPLIFSARSEADVTLVINGPDGRWHCDDDGGVAGLGRVANPMLTFPAATAGRYDVWVGVYERTNGYPPATLAVSERYGQ